MKYYWLIITLSCGSAFASSPQWVDYINPQQQYMIVARTNHIALPFHPADQQAITAESRVEAFRGFNVDSKLTGRPDMTVRRVIHFPFDSDRPTDAEGVGKLAKAYKRFVIEGHTDVQGEGKYNQRLASRRATHIANTLREAGAEDVSEFNGGERFPLCRDETEACHAKNRRAVIRAE